MITSNKTPKASAAKTAWVRNTCIALIAILIGLVAWVCLRPHSSFVTTNFHGQDIVLEKASTAESRSKGLGGRSWMAANQGMLFVFDRPGTYCFWMKDTHIPLDMIWLNEHKEVIFTQQNVAPATFPNQFCPTYPGQYVIELNAGQAASRQIRLGSVLSF